MSYSLRSKGRAPLGELKEKEKKKTPRKSTSRRKSTDGGAAGAASETDTDAALTSCSELDDSNSCSPGFSSPLASLIEGSWKSGIAELIRSKEGKEAEDERAEGDGREKHEGEEEEVEEEEEKERKPAAEGGAGENVSKSSEDPSMEPEQSQVEAETEAATSEIGKSDSSIAVTTDRDNYSVEKASTGEKTRDGGESVIEVLDEDGSDIEIVLVKAGGEENVDDEKDPESGEVLSREDEGAYPTEGRIETRDTAETFTVFCCPNFQKFDSAERGKAENGPQPLAENYGMGDSKDEGLNDVSQGMESERKCDNEEDGIEGKDDEEDGNKGIRDEEEVENEGKDDHGGAGGREENEKVLKPGALLIDQEQDEEEKEGVIVVDGEVIAVDNGEGEGNIEDEERDAVEREAKADGSPLKIGRKSDGEGDGYDEEAREVAAIEDPQAAVINDSGSAPVHRIPEEPISTLEKADEGDEDGNNVYVCGNLDDNEKSVEPAPLEISPQSVRDKNENIEAASKDAVASASVLAPVSRVPDDPFPLPEGADDEEEEEDDDEEDDDEEARELAALFKDPEEAALESLVFGDTDEIVQELEKKEKKKDSKKRKRSGGGEGLLDGEENKTSVWSDEDDDERVDTSETRRRKHDFSAKRKGDAISGSAIEGAALKKKLKRDFEKVMGGTPSWAMKDGGKKKKKNKNIDTAESNDDDDDDDDDDKNPLLTRAGNFLNKDKGEKLGFGGGLLDFKKCFKANRQERGKKIKNIQFHPTAQVLMTTGLDETLRLYQVDGVQNSKIQSVAFEKFHIHQSAFTVDGNSVILTSKKPWFKIYDMMTGNTTHVPAIKNKEELNKFGVTPDGRSIAFLGSHGFVYVVDIASKEITASVKMNARVTDVAFVRGSGDLMLTHGDGGSVYVWDFRHSASCVHKFVDDGCVNGTVVRASSDSRLVACGSASGIVNVYSAEEALRQAVPKPRRTMQNLLTTIRDVEFNRTCELMAFATGETVNGVRMAHVPTMNVFSNFPSAAAMGKPRAVAFSPFSGYFAVADSKDIVNLYRLNHYENF